MLPRIRIRRLRYGPRFNWWRMTSIRIGWNIGYATNLIPGTYIYLTVFTDQFDNYHL